ncbi:MAG: YdeI/OmpD-associated family protein [Bauldia sp.]|nr:YdeI/OmpD-associated family protein [Bauldia sp.]
MAEKPDYPTRRFATATAFETWLAKNHATAEGVWLQLAKKASGKATVSYAEAVEVALCYGWIDGHVKPVDEASWKQKFTPRRARSKWSAINVGRAERLIAEGRMQPAGLAAIEAAKADGRWAAAYASPKSITVPDDLRAALGANLAAGTAFAALTGTNRYAILYRVHDAKKPETRARRIAQYVAMLARGETLR